MNVCMCINVELMKSPISDVLVESFLLFLQEASLVSYSVHIIRIDFDVMVEPRTWDFFYY